MGRSITAAYATTNTASFIISKKTVLAAAETSTTPIIPTGDVPKDQIVARFLKMLLAAKTSVLNQSKPTA